MLGCRVRLTMDSRNSNEVCYPVAHTVCSAAGKPARLVSQASTPSQPADTRPVSVTSFSAGTAFRKPEASLETVRGIYKTMQDDS